MIVVHPPCLRAQVLSALRGRLLSTTSNARSPAPPFSVKGKDVAKSDVNVQSEPGKVLRMVMFGKPGAGKGTLSARLVKKYDILSLSTGDILRQHIAEG
jgi:nucleoside-triphosphate--adenylate kinase